MNHPSRAPTNRGTWIVTGILAISGILLVGIAIGIVRRSDRQPAGDALEYGYLLSAVDELLALDGGRQVLRVVAADTAFARREVRYDTLVIDDAASALPSLGAGGFLYDEVRLYNAFQRERLAIADRDLGRFAALEPYNPSIFRSFRRGDGTLAVNRTAAAWNRRVRSPFEDGWQGDVRTRDASSGWGLHSPHGSLSFNRPRRLTRRVDGRTQVCEFEPRQNDAIAYCLSEARTPQAIFREAVRHEGRSHVVAGWTSLRMDGERVRPGDSLRLGTGSVVRIAPLEPVVFAPYQEGVLSSRQWINGRMRRQANSAPPLDLFTALGRNAADPDHPPDPEAGLVLTLSERASRILTAELRDFVDDLPLPVEFGTVVLARIPDGAILAVAEVGTRSEPGRSRLLERVVPGSAVKPLLAAALLSERPELGTLEIPARAGLVRSVLGARPVPTSRAFSSTLNCGAPASGRVDLRYFLSCSNNEYAAALVLAGIAPDAGGPVGRTTLLRSSLADGMAKLYGLHTDPVIADSLRRSPSVWRGLNFSDGTPARAPYEVMPDASRPALLASGHVSETDLDLLYRYAFGAWENRWNVFDLTQAFARVTTDRTVELRFAPRSTGDSLPPAPLGLADDDWYAEFLRGLRDAGSDGTGRGLSQRWSADGLPLGVFVKTGTLVEPEARGQAGLFVKSLLFGVGENASGSSSPLECGVVGSVYLSFERKPRGGSLPSYQIEFARTGLRQVLVEEWEDLGVCASTASLPPQ